MFDSDFSPLCASKCVLKLHVQDKIYSHRLHLYGFSPVSIFRGQVVWGQKVRMVGQGSGGCRAREEVRILLVGDRYTALCLAMTYRAGWQLSEILSERSRYVFKSLSLF